MHLYLSDLHLGRGGHHAARDSERAVIGCLEAHADVATGLSLVGDVFEAFIEYPTLVPKGFVRFQGLLAAWADRGIPITYLAGNHDPWHLTYVEQELGLRFVADACVEAHHGRRVYLHHGDGLPVSGGVYRHAKPVLRHPWMVRLYRSILPGDAGLRLAHWVNDRFGHRRLDLDLAKHVEPYARELLSRHATDLVVMGHTHHHVLRSWPEGCYLNTGYWHGNRTFGRLTETGLTLCRWTDAGPVVLAEHTWAMAPARPDGG
ncbi:MAG: UDP-2,3-diacylglucosamine diphosphatase [Bacteroidota bacterium]